ncbi:MAG: hypothetical protein J0I79_21730 [Mesorhizobium sp.]|uniref:hypothetical protein n=1 Tax=Mesorhizobium sp. TaxID=1871066 RepID=UPI001AC5E90F|nr:hypothetical protein [Mesorhizobium sp.]MBN9220577.1 hypothetical protein [Mesorhizobium sp.]
MRAGLVLLSVMVAPSLALAGDFPVVEFPMTSTGITFSTPSVNIECTYTPRSASNTFQTPGGQAELSCDRAEPVYLRFVMDERGKVQLIKDLGEQPCCSGNNPLAYGSAWEMPPFRCESTASGLTCERRDGHGFFISRASTKVY